MMYLSYMCLYMSVFRLSFKTLVCSFPFLSYGRVQIYWKVVSSWPIPYWQAHRLQRSIFLRQCPPWSNLRLLPTLASAAPLGSAHPSLCCQKIVTAPPAALSCSNLCQRQTSKWTMALRRSVSETSDSGWDSESVRKCRQSFDSPQIIDPHHFGY